MTGLVQGCSLAKKVTTSMYGQSPKIEQVMDHVALRLHSFLCERRIADDFYKKNFHHFPSAKKIVRIISHPQNFSQKFSKSREPNSHGTFSCFLFAALPPRFPCRAETSAIVTVRNNPAKEEGRRPECTRSRKARTDTGTATTCRFLSRATALIPNGSCSTSNTSRGRMAAMSF